MLSHLRTLQNIAREVKFFEETAEQNHLDLQTQAADSRTGRFGLAHETDDEALLGLVSPLTRGYIDYQLSVASGASWEEGLVLLWAMEKVSNVPRASKLRAQRRGGAGARERDKHRLASWMERRSENRAKFLTNSRCLNYYCACRA